MFDSLESTKKCQQGFQQGVFIGAKVACRELESNECLCARVEPDFLFATVTGLRISDCRGNKTWDLVCTDLGTH